MSPAEIYEFICKTTGLRYSKICELHSACGKNKTGGGFLCKKPMSQTDVLNFDEIKTYADELIKSESRCSVDALTVSGSGKFLCFVELKSWELFLQHTKNNTERNVQKQVDKYKVSIPRKLADSVSISRQIIKDEQLDYCAIAYILVTDISTEDDGLGALCLGLDYLAESATNLKHLCNRLSKEIMQNIPNIESRYCECREFDNEILNL